MEINLPSGSFIWGSCSFSFFSSKGLLSFFFFPGPLEDGSWKIIFFLNFQILSSASIIVFFSFSKGVNLNVQNYFVEVYKSFSGFLLWTNSLLPFFFWITNLISKGLFFFLLVLTTLFFLFIKGFWIIGILISSLLIWFLFFWTIS